MKKVEEDITLIVKDAKELGFSNRSFLITGATGMIGRIFVSALRRITQDKNIYVLGFDYDDCNRIYKDSNVNQCIFKDLDKIQSNIDYIVHLASPTNSTFLANNPVETIDFIYSSTKQILDFALKHNSKVLYISSMEAYGEVLDATLKFEDDLGNIALTNTRNSYPESKRLCELLCKSYSLEYGLQVCTARLAQTFGAGTISSDPRIFGYLGRCYINKEDIILKTKGDSYGNYCYIADTLRAFLYILSKGVNGETYNVVGDNCRCTILELANLVAKEIAKDSIKIKIDLSNRGEYPNPTKLNMSNVKLKSIGWSPLFTLKDMFANMIKSWQE